MTTLSFSALKLESALLSSLNDLGYETPTPIQEKSIPVLLDGRDLLAQAQTGTGKTAAFALPLLSRLDLKRNTPQAIILAPTRELAIQVAEAFQSYAKHLKGFRVAPIYGGQDYNVQLRALKRGVHVIVGTPGRTMDHLRRGTLSIQEVTMVVLDEADEMLKMGFIDDIQWILDQVPEQHQTALFSATMPDSIQRVAKNYLNNPEKIHIQPKERAVDAIEQCYIRVSRNQKMDILTHFLDTEEVDAAIIFSRTKNYSTEVADKLKARGYAAAALNGDMNQAARERVLKKVKSKEVDIIVATDVAARGIDIDRISHVINFDIPSDAESYIHRIGRTGRAGRQGKALLFVAAREQRLLKDIERVLKQPIQEIAPPSLQEMKAQHSRKLTDKIIQAMRKKKKLVPYYEMIEAMTEEGEYTLKDIAAGLASLVEQANPMPEESMIAMDEEPKSERRRGRRRASPFKGGRTREGAGAGRRAKRGDSKPKKQEGSGKSGKPKKRPANKARKRNSGKSRAKHSG